MMRVVIEIPDPPAPGVIDDRSVSVTIFGADGVQAGFFMLRPESVTITMERVVKTMAAISDRDQSWRQTGGDFQLLLVGRELI